MGNVGAARDYIAANGTIPRDRVAHYVTVVADTESCLAGILTCCDGVDDAVAMLSGALAAITGGSPLAPDCGAVIVQRDDLRAALGTALIPDAVRHRLREALGEAPDGKGGDGDTAGLLAESQRFQVQEARDCLGTWDLARAGVAGIDRETVLADQLRAMLAIVDAVAPAAREGRRR